MSYALKTPISSRDSCGSRTDSWMAKAIDEELGQKAGEVKSWFQGATAGTGEQEQPRSTGGALMSKEAINAALSGRVGFVDMANSKKRPVDDDDKTKKLRKAGAVMQFSAKYIRIIAVILVVTLVIVFHFQGFFTGGVSDEEKSIFHKMRKKYAGTDKHESCPVWASKGGCESNPAYMEPTCPKSCSSAETGSLTFVDLNQNTGECFRWAGRGECQTNAPFMMVNCQKTCYDLVLQAKAAHSPAAAVHPGLPTYGNTPGSAHGPAAGPQDKNEYCHEWAMAGECTNNPKFMMHECLKSCSRVT